MKRIVFGIILPKTIDENWITTFAANEKELEYFPEHRALGQIINESDDDKTYSIEEVMEIVAQSEKKSWHPNFNHYLKNKIRENSEDTHFIVEPRLFPLYDSLLKNNM
ncbi:hypothetical protein [Bacillus sp. Brlt_9]|uniref:hypothetical protein n=1 Tax=Bacillus sp. Brlt_9 TaxID=3110916 RepID=UPI003F7B5089